MTKDKTTGGSYMLSYLSSLAALQAECDYHEAQCQNRMLPMTQQLEEAQLFMDLARRVADLRRTHEALMAQFTQVKRPDAAVAANARKLAEDLAAAIVKTSRSSAILSIATKFVKAWSALATPAQG